MVRLQYIFAVHNDITIISSNFNFEKKSDCIYMKKFTGFQISKSSTVEISLHVQDERRRNMREGAPTGFFFWIHSEQNPIGVLQINATQPLL